MKKKSAIETIYFIMFLMIFNCRLVAQDWQLGGNPDFFPPPAGLLNAPANNFIGGTQTADIRIGTANVSRIFIAGTSTPPPVGFVGIGANFVNPNQLLTVDGGNINVQTGAGNNGYMINNIMTLWRGNNGSATYI